MRLTEFPNRISWSTCFEAINEVCTCIEKYSKTKLVLPKNFPGVLMIYIPLHELAKLIFASISRCVFYPLNILFSCLDLVFIFSTFVKIDWVVHSKWFDSLRTSLTYNCLCLRFVFVTKYTIAIIHNFQNLQIQPKVFQYSNW